MVVDNKYAGVKLKDPIHVKSLNYFDESKPSVDGIQTAEEVDIKLIFKVH
jgi:hypothetical protein